MKKKRKHLKLQKKLKTPKSLPCVNCELIRTAGVVLVFIMQVILFMHFMGIF